MKRGNNPYDSLVSFISRCNISTREEVRLREIISDIKKFDESASLPSSSVTREVTGKTKEQCLKDRDVSIDRWPDTRDLIYLSMDDYAKQFVTGESEGERKFTLKEAIDIWKACYDWHHDPESPDKKEYFKQTFGIDI